MIGRSDDRVSVVLCQHWLRRAYRRGLLSAEDVNRIRPVIDELAPKLNAYLRSIGSILETGRFDEDKATDNGLRTTNNLS
jgi:hypothetical protein